MTDAQYKHLESLVREVNKLLAERDKCLTKDGLVKFNCLERFDVIVKRWEIMDKALKYFAKLYVTKDD